MADRRSPWWVFVLLALIHVAAWVATVNELYFAFYLAPRMNGLFRHFNINPPSLCREFAALSDLSDRAPALFGLLPFLDLALLFVLHRLLPSRLLRCVWSLLVIVGLLLLLFWGAAAGGLAVLEVHAAIQRQGG
jgi:hypothetical protein